MKVLKTTKVVTVRSLGYRLNNIHFVALHVLMSTMPSSAVSSQGCLAKFYDILMVLIDSHV